MTEGRMDRDAALNGLLFLISSLEQQGTLNKESAEGARRYVFALADDSNRLRAVRAAAERLIEMHHVDDPVGTHHVATESPYWQALVAALKGEAPG